MAFETAIFEGCEGFIYCLFVWANSVTEGFFMTLMLIGLAIIIFMATFNFGVNRAFGFSCGILTLGTIILLQTGLIPTTIGNIIWILGALGVVAMIISERGRTR